MSSTLGLAGKASMRTQKSLLLAFAGCALGSFVIPVITYAQGNTWTGTAISNMVDSARWRTGALRINAALALANAGYDTDIYYGYFDEPVPDVTALASLPVQLLLPVGKKVILDVYESPEYAFFLDTEQERAWNNVLRVQTHVALDRLYIAARGELSNVRQRLSPELNINYREIRNSLGGTLLLQTSQKISVAALVEKARYEYTDAVYGDTNISDSLSRDESYFDWITYIQPNSRVRFFVDGQYGLIDFREASASVRNTRSYAGFAGLTFIPREGETRPVEPAQGRISLGYKRFDIVDDRFTDGSALVGAITFSMGVFKKTVARIAFFRDFEFSVYPGSIFFYSTTYGGGLSRRLSLHSTFSYDLTFDRVLYPPAEEIGIPSGTDLRYTTHRIALDVRLARHLEMSFFGFLSQRKIIDPGASFDRNFIGFSLVYGSRPQSILLPERGLAR
jgi:hypothetical protein